MKKRLQAADLFCGAGGFTTGAVQADIDVILAVNHWRTAIQTHRHNHESTRHICARIDAIDIRHDATIPDIDLLMASPECTHHSIARGGRPMCDQKRSTAWNVLDWVETKQPRWVIVENVREFRDWGPLTEAGRPIKARKGEIFKQWIRSLEAYGYQVDHQVLNAADFGAATSRSRLFIVARRGRRKTAIPWPEITHPKPAWRPAHEIIDWSKPCPSIFSRKRPLATTTLKRIGVGLRKFVGEAAEPFIVKGTITAGGTHHSLAVPFQMKAIGRNPGATRPITDTVPTIVAARENHSIVMPFITQYHNGPDGANRNYSIGDPLLTLDTQNRYGVVAPYFVTVNHGGQQPLGTLTTKNSLIDTMGKLGVVDIGFRMLDVDELLAAQGFPSTYELFGNKADRVRQIGNSVSPPVARALCQCCAEAG